MRFGFWAGALLAALPLSTAAGDILIYNTGLDATGNALADFTTDPHWTVDTYGSASTAPAPSNALLDNSTSSWVYIPNQGPNGYTFSQSFNLSIAQPEQLTITGLWAAYSNGMTINLDGTHFGSFTGFQGYNAWTPFSITGTVTPGANTLGFLVNATPNGNTPYARVEVTSVTTPEPSALSWVVLCGTALLTRMRRTHDCPFVFLQMNR